MIKSKRRINKRDLIEGSRTDRVPSHWETLPWFITLCKAVGREMALKMGLDARSKDPVSWAGDDTIYPACLGSVVVWNNTSYPRLWSNAYNA